MGIGIGRPVGRSSGEVSDFVLGKVGVGERVGVSMVFLFVVGSVLMVVVEIGVVAFCACGKWSAFFFFVKRSSFVAAVG